MVKIQELEPDEVRKRRKRPTWQFGILSALLLTAVFASWFAWYRSKSEAELYAKEIPAMRLAARELDIKNPANFAAALQESDWQNEETWLVYLPEGHTYKLHGKFSVFEGNQINETQFEVEVGPGEHRVGILDQTLSGNRMKASVWLNGEEVFSVVGDSLSSFGTSSSGSGEIFQSDIDSVLRLKESSWAQVTKPESAKEAFDARDKTKDCVKALVYIRATDPE